MSHTGPEYGTTQAAWKGVLTEAERVADLTHRSEGQVVKRCPDEYQTVARRELHQNP